MVKIFVSMIIIVMCVMKLTSLYLSYLTQLSLFILKLNTFRNNLLYNFYILATLHLLTVMWPKLSTQVHSQILFNEGKWLNELMAQNI